jgi:signal transduction histidine kinase
MVQKLSQIQMFFARQKRIVISRIWWVFHPISIFVVLQILWTTVLTLWIIWFVGRRREIEKLASQISPSLLQTDDTSAVVLIIIGIVFLSMIGAGTILLFVWGQRQSSFIRQQRHFVSSVTHELRTPLASIHLTYETLLNRTLPEVTKQKLLRMSVVDIERLIRLVNQILISSRLDRGLAMFNDDIQNIRINAAIENILATLTHLDEKITQRISIDCPGSLQWKGSLNAFNIVVGNLLENAIKYSSPGDPIDLSVVHGINGLEVAVKDRGIGVSKRERKRIFKMFYRSGDATSRAIPGTGLGLFIVKTTLEQLGGRISVASDGPGEGSTFVASFPA